jgi:hypothetical protein
LTSIDSGNTVGSEAGSSPTPEQHEEVSRERRGTLPTALTTDPGRRSQMERKPASTDDVVVVADTSVRPFRVEVPQEALDDLRVVFLLVPHRRPR